MFIEVHVLQNFAPSNLNRDDTGAPKDCDFGGYRRARISSQALKRAVRTEFASMGLLPPEQLGTRTRRLRQRLVSHLVARGRDEEAAGTVADTVIGALKLRYERDTPLTQYLIFLGASEIEQLATFCENNWDEIQGATLKTPMVNAIRALLDGGKAADVALFGRMLADLPDRNIDAASQVAHAISTNRVNMEFDFYTAVDDLRPEDTEGAEMLGTVQFNSSCFYRYANVDIGQLLHNLGGDAELAKATVDAYLRALVSAIPTGKQNSMAAQNPPSFILTVVRDSGLWSLANAFLDPVQADGHHDLIISSQRRLDNYWARLTSVYGDAGVRSVAWVAIDDQDIEALAPHKTDTFDQLVERTTGTAFSGNGGMEAV